MMLWRNSFDVVVYVYLVVLITVKDVREVGALVKRPVDREVTSSHSSSRVVNRQTENEKDDFTLDPCDPIPCGPNTICLVERSRAICRCKEGFFPKPDTITGCGPQCERDAECPITYKCDQNNKCVDPCTSIQCGENAYCSVKNHKGFCSCFTGYVGDPDLECHVNIPNPRSKPVVANILAKNSDTDNPCSPNPCGVNAECRVDGLRAVCSCPIGYTGEPLTNCRRGECIEHSDCSENKICDEELRCSNPCGNGVCGTGAECSVVKHIPVCICPKGTIGDAFESCRPLTEADICSAVQCGNNTDCKVKDDRAICSCKEGYRGDPIGKGCYHECEADSDCDEKLSCNKFQCVSPCFGYCGENAECHISNHKAECKCPKGYLGSPLTECYPECLKHEDCDNDKACTFFQCSDPCLSDPPVCGIDADCKTEKHQPICSCPKGWTGHPFEKCRKFEPRDLCEPVNPCGEKAECSPGKDKSGNDRPVCICPVGYIGDPLVRCTEGDCKTHSDCPEGKACYGYSCQDPCLGACGTNADCERKEHGAICSCPKDYTGDPLRECYPKKSPIAATSAADQ